MNGANAEPPFQCERIVLVVDPVVQAFRKQRTLATVRPLDKALHPIPRKSRGNRIARAALSGTFSHSQGQTEKSRAITRRSANRLKADILSSEDELVMRMAPR